MAPVIYSAVLIALCAINVLQRYWGGLELISDERFYVFFRPDLQSKRVLFLQLVQSFDNWRDAYFAVFILNTICVVISFNLIRHVYFGNSHIAFFQLVYFTAVSGYLFRDCMILLFVALTIYFARRRDPLSLGLAALSALPLLDFRPQFVLFFLAALAAGIAVLFARNRVLFVFLLLFGAVLAIVGIGYAMQNVTVYSISLGDYIDTREERNSYRLTPISFVIGFLRHYFAPIPTSLLARIFFPWNYPETPYGVLDDIYRLAYKSAFYLAVGYCALNARRLLDIVGRYKWEAAILAAFSLANATVYTIFGYGGGHERVKVFSTLIIFYLAAMAFHHRKRASARASAPVFRSPAVAPAYGPAAPTPDHAPPALRTIRMRTTRPQSNHLLPPHIHENAAMATPPSPVPAGPRTLYIVRTNALETEARVARLFAALTRRHVDVKVLGVVKRDTSFEFPYEEYTCRADRIGFAPLKYAAKYLESQWAALRFVQREGRKGDTLVLANFEFLLLGLLLRLFGKRVIIDLHEHYFQKTFRRHGFSRFFFTKLFSGVSFANSTRAEDFFGVGQLNDKVAITRNMPDEPSRPIITPDWVAGQRLKIAIVGGPMPGRFIRDSITALDTPEFAETVELVCHGPEIGMETKHITLTEHGRFKHWEIEDHLRKLDASLVFYDPRINTNNRLCEPNRFFQAFNLGKLIFCFEHETLAPFYDDACLISSPDDFAASFTEAVRKAVRMKKDRQAAFKRQATVYEDHLVNLALLAPNGGPASGRTNG